MRSKSKELSLGPDEPSYLYQAASRGDVATVRLILKQDPKYHVGGEETSPLYISAQEGFLDVVKVLVKNGQDIEFSYREGFTPLYIASQRGKLDVVKYLYRKGANPNVKCMRTQYKFYFSRL